MGAVTIGISDWEFSSGGTTGFTKNIPGPYYVTLDHNALHATPNNGVAVFYLTGVSCSPFLFGAAAIVPDLTFTGNVTVTDSFHLSGDNACTGPSQWISAGSVPQLWAAGNVFFNHLQGTGITCANCDSLNPGVCPAGQASAPATINSTLGIANYATCAAGDATPTLPLASLNSCIITGTYAGTGPNIAKIQAAEIEPNDSLKWGPRTPF